WRSGAIGIPAQTLDLVHPSLYPIIYGRTRSSDSTVLTPPPEPDSSLHYAERALSNSFCWLPSDFSIGTDGSVKLVSPYINNLHPTTHKSLYPLIESVLSSFVPLFKRVLSQINGQDRDLYRDITPGSGRIMAERTFGTWAGYNWKFAGIAIPCIWSQGKLEYEFEMGDSAYNELLEKQPKALPEAFKEYTGELEKSIVPYPLKGKTIQCIIKLANIHLTAENPECKGGSWHVEGARRFRVYRVSLPTTRSAGMLNEHIVASGIYVCSDLHRRLPGRLTLKRQATTAGRALAWPNIYQHRVAPFRLVDPTKPGHRKILAIFLVDPSIEPIPSATNVPPQQADWAFGVLEESRGDPASTFSRLPPELSNAIHDRFPDTFMTRKEAETYRLSLMKERTTFDKAHDRELSYSFNMCEH
ncbi:hypothetical protein DFH09DRAFT_1411340, partial [Mycena vulgaris]